MPMESSVNDVFRFVQLRPRRPLGESAPIPLQDDTSLAQSLLQETSPAGRASTANTALKTGQETVGSLSDLPLGAEIVAALSGLREVPGSTTDDLVQKVPEPASFLWHMEQRGARCGRASRWRSPTSSRPAGSGLGLGGAATSRLIGQELHVLAGGDRAAAVRKGHICRYTKEGLDRPVPFIARCRGHPAPAVPRSP